MNLLKDLFKQEKNCKTEGGKCYPASDFAVTPDKTKPSTWKLRLSQGNPGNITKSQLGRAVAAFSPGGFRGNKVQLSSAEATKAKTRIRSEYKKLGVKPEDMPDAIKEKALDIWLDKETNRYRWLATYSNNFRDNDNPPEIISEDSHKAFVKGVEDGTYPYPELWMWHVPGSRIGIADWLAYTDEGFAVASGTFDEGKEQYAKSLSENPNLLVSHGMPRTFVKRDPNDESVIIQHVTREISPLPAKAAANKLTGFELLSKEGKMIPEEKFEWLKANGASDEEIEQLKTGISQKKKQAEAEQRESKEETPADNQDNDTVTNPVPEKKDELTLNALAALIQQGNEAIAKRFDDFDSRLKEIEKSDEEKITEKAANIPSASRQALLQKSIDGLFGKESQIDGRSSIAKSGPKEADAQPQSMFFENWLKPVQEAQ